MATTILNTLKNPFLPKLKRVGQMFPLRRSSLLIFIVVFSFLVGSGAQAYGEWFEGQINVDTVIDGSMWAHQAEYVVTDNPKEFDYLAAYGHPGGPIIELTVLGHYLGLAYDVSLAWVLILIPGLLIASICLLCELLRPKSLWWLGALPVLSFHWGYLNYATPPSRIAALLTVLLSLLTLYLLEQGKGNQYLQAVWALLCGIIVATRVDIGSCVAAFCGLTLLSTMSLKRMGSLIIIAIGAFWLTDPFMWFMPLQHLQDLLFKIVYHYSDFPETESATPFWLLARHYVQLLAPSLMGMVLAISALFVRDLRSVRFPARFILGFTAVTLVLYAVFSTAHYQAERYYLPTMLFWETILIFFFYACLDRIVFSQRARVQWWSLLLSKIFVTTILVGYPLFPVYSAIRNVIF